MIIHTTNIIAGPLVLVIWAIDVYLLLVSVRLIAGRLQGVCCNRLCQGLKPLTDPLPEAIQRRIVRWKRKTAPIWVPWLIVILGAIITRHLLVCVIVSVL